MGDPIVYQAAKYNALAQLPDADNLISIRAEVVINGDEQCVTVTGRAYRITSLRSTALAPAPGATAAWTPLAWLSPPPGAGTVGQRSHPDQGAQKGDGGAHNAFSLLFGNGLSGWAGATLGGPVVGADFGVLGSRERYSVMPLAGVAAGYSFREMVRPFVALRGGVSLIDDFGPAGMAVGGVALWRGSVGVRAEAGLVFVLDEGVEPHFSGGPTFTF